MISSEVQRTLVKSPPELWTELSDPEALARHLGELGEIKITRIEPETLVEWEAEGTTGTVAIKASGWGTKVTLSVNRELPATEAAEPSPLEETASAVAEEEEEKEKKKKKEEDEEDHHLGPVEPEGDAALPTEIEAAPTEEGEAAAEPQDEAAAPPEGETAPAEEGDAAAERKPAPATEAARRAAGWPSAAGDTPPAIESDLRAAEDSDSLEAVRPEWGDEVEAWAGQAPEAPTEQASPEREPRRGFLARLFGKRRRGARVGGAQPLHAAEAEPEAAESEDPALVLSEETFAQQETVLDDEPTTEEEPLAEAEAEAEPTAEEDALIEAEPEPTAEEDALIEAEPEPRAEGEASADAEPAQATEGEALAEPEPEPDPDPASEEEPPAKTDPEGRQQGEDLAAELKAAEEIAAEQVTAVLTGVLDRLGAAHHRPFSRA